ncbi:integral membrane protein [Phlyctema vagabunda]|uniref:Integral membrane protein n=1 Tax=Phlyctema vagabunda TaxID=108571 RepID=A0ABR4PXP2_9HELO
MQLPPASVLESWPTPNYVDPPVHGKAIIIMNLTFYPVVLLIMVLRVFTRCTISKSFGADDYLIIAALLPITGFTTIALLAELRYDLNRHIWDVTTDNVISGLKVILASQIIFTVAQTLTKLSMLSLIYRIMSNTSVTLKNWTKFIMVFVSLCATTFIFVVIFQCRPMSNYWTFSVEPQQCINEPLHVLVASILNTLNDVIVVIFPIPTVWSLQLPRRQQIVVIVLFAGGFGVCIAGGIRTFFTYKMLSSYDRTWDSYGNWLSSSIELYVGVICASIPATKPFFQRFLPKVFGSGALSCRTSRYYHSGTKDKSSSSQSSTFTDFELGPIRGSFKKLEGTNGDEPHPGRRLHVIAETEADLESGYATFIGQRSRASPSTRREYPAGPPEGQRINFSRPRSEDFFCDDGASRR